MLTSVLSNWREDELKICPNGRTEILKSFRFNTPAQDAASTQVNILRICLLQMWSDGPTKQITNQEDDRQPESIVGG